MKRHFFGTFFCVLLAFSQISGSELGGSSGSVFGPIPVFFHVITDSSGVDGYVDERHLADQTDWLNHAFSGVPVLFYLAGSATIANQEWFENLSVAPGDSLRESMYRTLSQDPATSINIFTVQLPEDNAHGVSHFPGADDENSYLNGILLDYRVITGMGGKPGQPLSDEGDWLVHEIGHYFGLHHTFNAGPWVCSEIQKGDPPPCRSSGDNICDTLPHVEPAIKDRTTCGQLACIPVDRENASMLSAHNSNYMNYTSDACRTSFTPDQEATMRSTILQHRPTLTSSREAVDTPLIDGGRLRVYPNPATNRIILDIARLPHKPVTWEIVTLDGRVAKSGVPTDSDLLTVETSSLSAGVYLLRVESASYSSTASFVVVSRSE